LPHRRIELPYQLANLLETSGRVRDDGKIGTRIADRHAALRKNRPLAAGRRRLSRSEPELLLSVARKHVREVLHSHVIELKRLRNQWLQLADLQLRFELLFLLDCKLLARRDQNDVAVLAHVEALDLHDDVKRLIPGNVLEAQREAAGDGVAGDDVKARKVSDHLQNRAHLDVLEVERELLALVPGPRPLDELVGIFLDRLDLYDEAVFGLVRGVLPQSSGLDDDARIAGLRKGVDGGDRSCEIAHVQPALEVARQRRVDEVDDQRLALLADVDAGGVVG